ncbi:MAG: glycosyl hydrolase family 28 protein [Verrucomicrobia bacterium]|nr:glycosyl hydrolase family 28 protein [Verrucomicrobiota bacterium]
MKSSSPRVFAPVVFWAACLALASVAAPLTARTVDLISLGAKAGDAAPVTAVLQRAIDEASAAGGGTVVVPAGVFISRPVQLRSHVTLRLERGAVLRGTDNPADSRGAKGFVWAFDADDIGIEGPGTIDGNGKVFEQRDSAPGRPHLIDFQNSRQVLIRDVTLCNAASWTCKLHGCDGVRVNAVRIYSHQGYNNDGFDIDSRNVAISDCLIDCDDDAICFKSDSAKPCENVTVTNCVAASNCNLIKMGTSGVGGFKNITVSNCVLRAASEDNRRQWKKKKMEGIALDTTGISGIALELVDGGVMDQVCLTNIAMTGIQTPIFIRLGNRKNGPGQLRNVIISNITATTESLICSSITGIPGNNVEGVILRDIRVAVLGNGTAAHAAKPVPEKEKSYPENRMFGDTLPAYGLYVRHAKGITLDNVQFTLRHPDARPAVILDDAHDIELRHLRAEPSTPTTPMVRIARSSGVAVSGFRSAQPLKQFAQVDDCPPGALTLSGNDFTGVERVSNLNAGGAK